jgi:hypothetical protein
MNDFASRHVFAPVASAPLIARSDHGAPSVFRPENMLREARRQKELASGSVPEVCVVDPDGDIVDFVREEFSATRCPHWACYHTRMWRWTAGGVRYGIIGQVVGGSFSVLVAEQLFASGCRLLINVASAGQITDVGPPPYYILIERAMRDEGTSYHYLPPSAYVAADPALIGLARKALRSRRTLHVGTTWTTDAPRFAKQLTPSRCVGRRAFSPSRWRRPRFMPLPRRASAR